MTNYYPILLFNNQLTLIFKSLLKIINKISKPILNLNSHLFIYIIYQFHIQKIKKLINPTLLRLILSFILIYKSLTQIPIITTNK